jgi:plasmid stabilization system protein ParE
MRRAFFAPSFLQEIEDIAFYIEQRFGEAARSDFRKSLEHLCSLLCLFPTMGKLDHDYPTAFSGFVFRMNWVFFEYDDDEVRFMHIVDGRREKPSFPF